jgi:hypothetical protein
MPLQGAFAVTQPLRTPLGSDPSLSLFSDPGKELAVGAETIAAWLSQEHQDWATGITVALHELLNDFFPWVDLYEPHSKQQTHVRGSLAAMGDLADQNRIPALYGFAGEWKAMYSVVIVEADGVAALMRAPGQITPFIDIFNPGDNFTTTFEIYVRNFGSGTAAGQRLREHIQDWDQAGRPASAKWHIRAVPAESEYHPTDGEFLVDKPWTKLIIRYQ